MDIKSVIVLALMCTAANGTLFGWRPGQQGSYGPGRSGYGQNRGQGLGYQKNPNCTKACISATQCPNREEIKSSMKAERKECKDCVMKECGAYDRSNRTDVSDCIMEAREECPKCPPMFSGNRERRANCTSCLRKCRNDDRRPTGQGMQRPGSMSGYGRRQGNSGQSSRPFGGHGPKGGSRQGPYNRGPYGARDRDRDDDNKNDNDNKNRRESLLQCRQSCVSSGNCTSLSELKMRMRAARNDCKECVVNDCGPYDRSNRSDVADCISDARMECDECPAMSSKEQGERRQCKLCIRKCVMKQNRRPTGQAMQRPGSMSGYGRRQGNSGQSSRPFGGHGPKGGSRQGPYNRGPYGARDRDRDDDNKDDNNNKNRRGSLLQCRQSCVSSGNCTSLSELKMRMRAARNACKECVVDDCGPYNKSNRSEIADCISDARMECDDCPAMSSQEQGERKQCKRCIRKCFMQQRQAKGNMTSGRPDRGRSRGSSYSGSGGRRRPFFGGRQRPTNRLQALLGLISCARNRTVCESCPTAKDLRQKMRNQSRECRNCVKEECGDIDKSNRTEVKECVSEARMECDDCSAVSEEDQMKRKNCSKCMRRCAVFRDFMSFRNSWQPYKNFPFGSRGGYGAYRFPFGGYGSSRSNMPGSNNRGGRPGNYRSGPGYFW